MVNSSATPIDFDTYSILRITEWDTRTTSAGANMQVMGTWEVLKRGIDVQNRMLGDPQKYDAGAGTGAPLAPAAAPAAPAAAPNPYGGAAAQAAPPNPYGGAAPAPGAPPNP